MNEKKKRQPLAAFFLGFPRHRPLFPLAALHANPARIFPAEHPERTRLRENAAMTSCRIFSASR
jgi:hypothetical protein